MSDSKKRSKRRKDEYTGPNGAQNSVDKASKDEFKIAQWIKKNVPTKRTKFLNHNVEYFTATKALDALMSSKFAQNDGCLFPTREIAIEFLDSMLVHRFFHRAKKVPVTEAELKRGKKSGTDKDIKEKDNNKDNEEKHKDLKKLKEEKVTDAESSHFEGSKNEKVSGEKEKKKRKIRLDMHPDQVFVDGSEAYVWIYDPIPIHYWLFGALLVVGAIVICLFPLWPPSLRKGVYYLSIAAAGFLVFILGLAVIRFIVFCLVWVLTGSKHHLWLFPNLTEDVGFFASFWPIYKYEYRDSQSKDKKNKKRKKDKNSDVEDDEQQEESANVTLLESDVPIENFDVHRSSDDNYDANENNSDKNISKLKLLENDSEKLINEIKQKDSNSTSESESESSQRSSTGKDFELVDPDDVEAT